MALPILQNWKTYFSDYHEGLGSSYERIILNNLLLNLKHRYKLESVLEAPVFGFTGITGLNSFALYQAGCKVTLLDHEPDRVDLIKRFHHDLQADIDTECIESYDKLLFSDKMFDMGWNFSALWFVQDLSAFLRELTRVSKKAVLLCVPNQYGLGYKWQKAHADIPEGIIFNENFINPELIMSEMQKLKWNLIREDFIDCPLWPDIGMNKEKFLGAYLSKIKIHTGKDCPEKQVSIIDYYKGIDPAFDQKMQRYSFLENYAPDFIKKLWSHHYWMLFEPAAK